MQKNQSEGLEGVIGSGALAKLILHFAMHSGSPLHFRALQRHTQLGNRSLQQELTKLIEWQLVTREEANQVVSFRSNPASARWKALRQLVRAFADPAEVLGEALRDVDGVEAAFVFGSSARGQAREDSDVDLFILGDNIPAAQLGRATSAAALLLDREVDVKRFTRSKLARVLQQGDSGFVSAALKGPKRWIVGSDSALEVEA
ncbi:MAG TPA: nucleotidyltransferase domain-containing protein [Longimicrobium sp.]|nr:nucleotidyltransferase domain-containing protein [Longimicrobium sp.]